MAQAHGQVELGIEIKSRTESTKDDIWGELAWVND